MKRRICIEVKRRLLRQGIILITAIALMSAFGLQSPSNAAVKGDISSTLNKDAGIEVKWTKNTKADGYYVLRKTSGATKWTRVKIIKRNTVTSWTDINVRNGVKYTYCVRTYKRKTVNKTSVSKVIVRLDTPVIEYLRGNADGKITI